MLSSFFEGRTAVSLCFSNPRGVLEKISKEKRGKIINLRKISSIAAAGSPVSSAFIRAAETAGLSAVEQDTESNYRTRDYAILTLFLNCGMRVSELVGIDLRDLDSDFQSVRVTGKGNKERIIYLNQACQTALCDYAIQRLSQKYAKVHDPALFLSRLEKRISVKTVQAMVYKYLRAAGLGSKGYSVHKLRHTAATPVGLEVRAEATVTAVDGKAITFEVRAFDEAGEIGSGTHKRFVVNSQRFLDKTYAKL